MEICSNRIEEKKLNEHVISEYDLRGYRVSIFIENESLYYSVKPKYDFNQDPLLFTELSALIYKNKERLGKDILKFDELVDTLKSICMWKILEIKNLPIDSDIFAELFIYKLINFDRVIYFFLDDNINEIYMDQKDTPIYIDHQSFGRCNTRVILEEEEIKSLLTRLKLEHPISVTTKRPSLKVEFKTKLFHLRISMDFPPLSPNGPTFNIRKLKTKHLTLLDLVRLETLTPLLASYFVEMVERRRNITIIGEPSAGKTTLANAIDLYTPRHWRKIAIEDAIESINQSSMGYKQLSIQVDSFESSKTTYTKTSEILKLLHRSPDWIYLGEIQSREHTQAMFEALNAGLKGIQTAHADTIEKILRRWENLHNIDFSDFLSLDLIIIIQREITENSFIRKVSEVYEVDKLKRSKEKYGFLIKIYDNQMDEQQLIENLEHKSLLQDSIDSILQRQDNFKRELENNGVV